MSPVIHPLEAEKENIEVDWMAHSDGSGSIDREEFLQIPQIATNPLASRMIAIFDQEYDPFSF
jgi:Ca2+-binding EF-hand superfamily protein